MANIAVLTGDLINSTGVASPKKFTQRLVQLLEGIESVYRGDASTFRGDGFQVSIPNPTDALTCAIYIRAGLIAASPSRRERWDARIAIAIAADNTNDGNYGDAYIESGRGLDEMTKQALYLYAQPEVFRVSAVLATAFADDIISHWSASEAEAYFVHLTEPGGHQNVANKLKKSRSTITKSLLRAKYTLIDKYLQDMPKLMELTHAH